MSFVKEKDGKKYLFIKDPGRGSCINCVADTDNELCAYLSTECIGGYFVPLAFSPTDNTFDARELTVPKKHAELIKAWADGAKIQRYDKPFYSKHYAYGKYLGGWKDVENPTWKDSTKYRLKPTKEMQELKELVKQKRDLEIMIVKLQNKIKGN